MQSYVEQEHIYIYQRFVMSCNIIRASAYIGYKIKTIANYSTKQHEQLYRKTFFFL